MRGWAWRPDGWEAPPDNYVEPPPPRVSAPMSPQEHVDALRRSSSIYQSKPREDLNPFVPCCSLNCPHEATLWSPLEKRPYCVRCWNGGLHQAVEAKEKVEVKPEQVTVASITAQSLFLLYPTLSGMTGTAKSEAKELSDTYGLDVLKVPTAKPLRREDGGDLVFKSKLDKFRYVLRDVKRRHANGQPELKGVDPLSLIDFQNSMFEI